MAFKYEKDYALPVLLLLPGFQIPWGSGSHGLSGLHVQSAVEEGSSPALNSAALHHVAASVVRARPATPKSALVSPSFLYNVFLRHQVFC